MNFNFVRSKTSIAFIIVLISVLGVSGFFIARQYAKSNVDYICTVTTPLEGACVVPPEGWGPYTLVAGSPGVTQSIGIGTKEVTLIQSYHSRRTSCGDGAVVASEGNSDGATGWYGFQSNVVGSACQIIRYGTISNGGGGGCPEGKELNSLGGCVVPLPDDYCINDDEYPGIQNPNSVEYPIPENVMYDKLYNCHDLLSTADECKDSKNYISGDPRIGLNTSVPTGYFRKDDGYCYVLKPGDVVKINVGFQCSVNKTIWNDCSKIVLPNRNQPIYLRADDNLVGNNQTWTIEDNNTEPLDSGESIGLFINNTNTIKSKEPYIKLSFGLGNSFTKKVELAYSGLTKNGLQGIGSITKILNIRIATQDIIIER